MENNVTESEPEVEPRAEWGGSASAEEIVLPPILIVTCILLCLLILSVVGQRNWWKSKIFTGARYITLKNPQPNERTKNGFFSEDDLDVLDRLKSFQNNPNSLVRVAVPTLSSMLLCPMTLFLYEPLLNFVWPEDRFTVTPDINTAINCFLMPAGLVYAIAFGFVFQDVMSSFYLLSSQITEQVSMFRQLVMMANSIKSFSDTQKKDICLCVKDEIIKWIQIITGAKEEANLKRSDRLFDIVNIIQQSKEEKESGVLDGLMAEQIVVNVLRIDDRTKSQERYRISNISFIQWIFMEILGFVSFFGILLISAQSYRMELIMCILTVLSLSLFCYILADFDCPFHGLFRIQLKPINELIGVVEHVHSEFCRNETDA